MAHDAQVINYLKATSLERALLIDFGTPKLQYKHLILSIKIICENLRHLRITIPPLTIEYALRLSACLAKFRCQIMHGSLKHLRFFGVVADIFLSDGQ